MSENQRQQNEKEELALEKVKSIIDYYLENDANARNCNLVNEIRKILDRLKPNPQSNDFPDFVMSNGYLEHFAVTSSKENKKGAEHIAKKKKFDEASMKIQRELSSDRPFVKHSFHYPQHSHEYLFSSIRKNVGNHLDRLEVFNGRKELGIFLIEYAEDQALSMGEYITNEIDKRFGSPNIISNYILGKDKKVLEWFYQYKEQLKFLIFLKSRGLEIIPTAEIPKILDKLPYDYIIAPNIGSVETEIYSNIQF